MIGVLRSSFLIQLGEPANGLRVSDGNVPEPGVCNEDAPLDLLSKPAAAIVAMAVVDAMIAYRRLRQRLTE